MKLTALTTLLAIGLMAFAVNVNAKSVEVVSIEVDNDSSLVDLSDSAEGSGSSESSESTEAPETTEAPEATDAPESTDPPQILSGRSAPAVDLDIEEVHKFIHHVMSTVGDMLDSVIDSVYEGKPFNIHQHHNHHHQLLPEEFQPIPPQVDPTVGDALDFGADSDYESYPSNRHPIHNHHHQQLPEEFQPVPPQPQPEGPQ